jgi:beta-lactamase class A
MKRSTYSRKKKNSFGRGILLTLGIGLILAALIVGVNAYSKFKAIPVLLPSQTSLSGIPLGNLNPDEALQRVRDAFNIPVELRYKGARMQFSPQELGFSVNEEALSNELLQSQKSTSFWNYIWNKTTAETENEIELAYNLDENQLSLFLNQIITERYDQPATAPTPILYSTNFTPAQAGYQLISLPETVAEVKNALLSPAERVIELNVSEEAAAPVNWANVEAMLRQTLLLERFNGLAEIYLQDMQNGQLMHFALQNNQDVPVDIAYSAASTIKIPIMVSVMRRLQEPLPNQATNWMQLMIGESLNPPADGLMKAYLDNQRGPLMVTADMRELGYQNTFLAGYFEPGSPLLEQISTAANQRRDIFLDPDLYNQTVPSEVGDLLAKIYHCSKDPNQALFNGQITSTECNMMLDYLKENKIHQLLETGLAPEATIAHKHGWTNETDGLLHTISDSAVISTPGGDYVLVVFAYKSDQFLFDEGNWLFGKLSQIIYNSYNPQNQAFWYDN